MKRKRRYPKYLKLGEWRMLWCDGKQSCWANAKTGTLELRVAP